MSNKDSVKTNTVRELPPVAFYFPVEEHEERMAEIQEMADAETEGNKSMLLRKLFREALAARRAAQSKSKKS